MSPTTLIFPITPEVHARLTRSWETLRQQALEKGIRLGPDGSFTGRATGKVSVERDKISVTITDKPFYVSVGAINDELKRLFA